MNDQRNGSGNGVATSDVITAAGGAETSLDGFSGAAPENPFADRPEVFIGVALLGGILLAGLVRRLGR